MPANPLRLVRDRRADAAISSTRGTGRSDKPREAEAYAMPVRVADVVAVSDGLGLERAHVLGISWAEGSASDSASMHPTAFEPS